jgi:hypothetical protein
MKATFATLCLAAAVSTAAAQYPTPLPGRPFPQAPQPQYPNQGYPNQGFPGQGYPNQGFPGQGYPNQGLPGQGFPNQGFPSQGFPNTAPCCDRYDYQVWVRHHHHWDLEATFEHQWRASRFANQLELQGYDVLIKRVICR